MKKKGKPFTDQTDGGGRGFMRIALSVSQAAAGQHPGWSADPLV